jgi:hypothetical protein
MFGDADYGECFISDCLGRMSVHPLELETLTEGPVNELDKR